MLKNRVAEILTPFDAPESVCVMGNEGVARAAIESGVAGVFAYPGTPSTEISMIFSSIREFQAADNWAAEYPQIANNHIYFEYSVNEKIALEKAIACSIGNKSSMACMKNVGLNVAADPLMTIPYQVINAPLVVIVCDDPGCHSSSNEQDSRHFAISASIPLLDPASPGEAYRMTREAFIISEDLKLPVIVRLTTRVSHGRETFHYNSIKPDQRMGCFNRDPVNINVPARTAIAHERLLEKLQGERIQPYFSNLNTKQLSKSDSKELAVITSGMATSYFLELHEIHELAGELAWLKIGMINPFPELDVLNFLQKGYRRILVLEELDPILENGIRIVAQKNHIDVDIVGKNFSGLTTVGEYSLSLTTRALEQFLQRPLSHKQPLAMLADFTDKLPVRPPTLCVGCPHRATFYAMKLVLPRNDDETILCGDIGCLGLGALPPMGMMDTVNHMGMSISMAQGLDLAIGQNKNGRAGKTIALIGDGTFFHSGMTSLLNAIYTNADISIIIFDNRTIAMTGGQINPGAPLTNIGEFQRVDIEKLVRGMGVDFVESMDPFKVEDTYQKIKASINHRGVSVLISVSPCVMLEYDRQISTTPVYVDHNKCKTCANHSDRAQYCSHETTPEYGLARARAKITAKQHIAGEQQACPANICNHGFFNAILAKDYQTALEIVRDKMLFARTCGDICHRPCERGSHPSVPIKLLKHFVAGDAANFADHEAALQRVRPQTPGHRVAIIGAGPAGLSTAYDLALSGYAVFVFEKEQSPGGVLFHQIPDFRMDKQGLQSEIHILKKLGVSFNYGAALGEQINLQALSREYDAVVLAIGVSISSTLAIVENTVPAQNRYNAMDFLKLFNESKLMLKNDSSFVVIGGGNSAIDAARAAMKLSPENRVILSCIEDRHTMPAFQDEIEEALREGVLIHHNSFISDLQCNSDDELTLRMKAYDSKKDLPSLQCNFIISAIGQHGDAELLRTSGIDTLDQLHRIETNAQSLIPSADNIFAAGDINSNHHMSLIGAIASGKKAAVSVRQLLEGYEYPYEGDRAMQSLNSETALEAESNITSLEDIYQYDLHQTCERCNHCIDNFACPSLVRKNGKITIEQSSCIRCGLCIDVCPNNAIQWQTETAITGEMV
ncbi:MAG: FAD-dependent oxidoreductase [Gammaproteobacteria bacterium]|nr:FAD-dependent oxidoreductase [Gammaproteobacteria bacterium]